MKHDIGGLIESLLEVAHRMALQLFGHAIRRPGSHALDVIHGIVNWYYSDMQENN